MNYAWRYPLVNHFEPELSAPETLKINLASPSLIVSVSPMHTSRKECSTTSSRSVSACNPRGLGSSFHPPLASQPVPLPNETLSLSFE